MMRIIKKEVKKRYIDLYFHFKREDVKLIACFSQYFLTIFLYDTPTSIGLRIFDIFLFEGERVLFDLIYRMLALKKEKLLNLQSQELFGYLRKRIVRECFEEFNLSTLFSSRRVEDIEMGNV